MFKKTLFIAFLLLITSTANAAVVIEPSEGTNGLFTLQNDNGFSLFDPSGMEASSTLCVASSTPLTYDCDVSVDSRGIYLAIDASNTSAVYNYLSASGTAAQLADGAYGFAVGLVNSIWPIAFLIAAILFSIFVMVAVIWAFRSAGHSIDKKGRRGLR